MGQHETKPVQPKFRKDDRICILGAGPGGMAAAYYLMKDKGYTNVTVIEKRAYVGGKCHSYAMDDGTYIDMGAVEVTEDYHHVIALLREFKMFDSCKHVVPPCTIDRATGEVAEIKDFVKMRATEGHRVYDRLGLSELAVVDQCVTYLNHVKKYSAWLKQPGCHNCPKELGVPFFQYLKDHGMAGIASMFVCPIPLFGYGHLHEICAGYAMKYINHGNFMTLLKRAAQMAWVSLLAKLHIKHVITEGYPLRLEKGYQSLVIGLEDHFVKLGGKMIKNTKTTKIVRENGIITLTLRTTTPVAPTPGAAPSVTVEEKTMEFDHLIIGFPQLLPRLQSMMTLSKQETEVFSAVKYMNYSSSLWRFRDTSELADGTKAMTEEQRAQAEFEAGLKKTEARRHNSLYGDLIEREEMEKQRAAAEAQLLASEGKSADEIQALTRQPTVHGNLPTFPTGIVCVVLERGKIIDNLQDGLPTLFFKRDDTRAVVSYAVHDDLKYTKEKFDDNARDTLCRLGYVVQKEPLESHAWEYFPHFEPNEFIEKNDQLFALQGQWNTFYVGGLLCFENVEKVVEYSHFLVDQFF